MISVWHNDRFVEYTLKGPQALKDTTVRLVAEVATFDLDRAFERTNHIDHSWTENPGVRVINKNGAVRSTSVGDVMIDGDKCYVVESAGFRELSKPELLHMNFRNT
jgi:hypothetical protein